MSNNILEVWSQLLYFHLEMVYNVICLTRAI